MLQENQQKSLIKKEGEKIIGNSYYKADKREQLRRYSERYQKEFTKQKSI